MGVSGRLGHGHESSILGFFSSSRFCPSYLEKGLDSAATTCTAATVRPPPPSPVGVVDRAERCAQHRRSQSRKSLREWSRHAPPPSPARVAHAPTSGETHSLPPPQTRSPEPPESIPRVGDDSFGLYLSRFDFFVCSFFLGETHSPSLPHKSRRSFLILFLGKKYSLGIPNDLPNIGNTSWLDGQNYLQWSQFILRILKSRSKLDHIHGGGPAPDDKNFSIWDKEDSLIMTWIWQSMAPEIRKNYMFHSSAKEIWEDLQSTFSLKKNLAATHDLKNRIFTTTQGSLSVSKYYGILNGLWMELDQIQTMKMCKTDAAVLAEFIEGERIFKFLHGLNHEYDQIREKKLGDLSCFMEGSPTQALPRQLERESTREQMLGEKRLKGVLMGTIVHTVKKSGHTKEICFKLHGRKNVLERMGNNKRPTQKWVHHTTSEREVINQSSPSQSNPPPPPDLDMKAYKEKGETRALGSND
ncbi:hypothetical protein V8G54_007127 [Vigna mungo]|uniref:Retrotransposon gag domain-containing protein n=1 Tax=Vigna mungo TaxID=3915 RepID=A0AAQ3P1A8_VIGMU